MNINPLFTTFYLIFAKKVENFLNQISSKPWCRTIPTHRPLTFFLFAIFCYFFINRLFITTYVILMFFRKLNYLAENRLFFGLVKSISSIREKRIPLFINCLLLGVCKTTIFCPFFLILVLFK